MLLFQLASLLALIFSGALAQLQINTPTTALSTCVNKRIQWSGGQPPYTVRVFPGGQLDADPLAVIALNTGDTNAVWRCTVEAGRSVTFAVEDDNGDVNGSAQVVVTENPSGDNSCLTGNGQSSTTTTTAADATSIALDASPSTSSSDEEASDSTSLTSPSTTATRTQMTSATSASRTSTSSSPSADNAAETGSEAAPPQSAALRKVLVDVGALVGSLFLAAAVAF